MTLQRQRFLEAVRTELFGGRLSAAQAGGLEAILDAWEASPTAQDLRWLGYILATAYHHSAKSMQPSVENGSPAHLTDLYDVRGSYPVRARMQGNTEPGDGPRYCARGYVPLAWKRNYEAMSGVAGRDLVADPTAVLQPEIAARILVAGMVAGSFTGRRLGDYFSSAAEDWTNARRIVAEDASAAIIALDARAFHAALRAATKLNTP